MWNREGASQKGFFIAMNTHISRPVRLLVLLLLILASFTVASFAIFNNTSKTNTASSLHFISSSHPISPTTYPANIDFEPLSSYGTYHPSALTNPYIGAVDINMNWATVEPQQGVFNFVPADNEVAAWAKQGKKFTLIVRYVNEAGHATLTNCNRAQLLPSWEIARIQHFCDVDKGTIIPDYFDPTFKADLETYVKAIATHFAQSPYRNNLEYVRIGVGLAAEGFYLMPCGNNPCDFATDKAQLVSWGYSAVVWKNWQEEWMLAYKSAFSYTTVIYPIVPLDTDPTTGQPTQTEVAYWAATQGMGVGAQGLSPYFANTHAPINKMLLSIHTHYPNTYIQFQTVAQVTDATEMQQDIQISGQLSAKSIEWYANDIVNPSYQSLLQQWQQTVASKFK